MPGGRHVDWDINPELFLTENPETEDAIENPADEELQDEYFKHDEYVVFTQEYILRDAKNTPACCPSENCGLPRLDEKVFQTD